MRRMLVFISVVLGACTSPRPNAAGEGPTAEQTKTTAPSRTAKVVGPSEEHDKGHSAHGGVGAADAGLDPSFAVVSKICAGTCGGPYASLQVFRNAAGAVGRLVFDGDPEDCSHPPRIYFDRTGTPTLTIPMEPVAVGSPEEKKLAIDQAAQTEGLTEAEMLGCTDPKMCAPKRTEGFVSEYACASDRDCMTCDCGPVDRMTWERRGGNKVCTNPDEECTATNAVCCDGHCVLSR